MSQSVFHASLLDPARPAPEGLTDGEGRPAGRRYAVYRNNVAVSLTEALESGFPTVARLLGTDNFQRVAGSYLRAEPPSSPMLMHYGEGFPAFLAGLAPLKAMGYLPDCARLDLALRHAYHAADATPCPPAALALDGTALANARLTLAPAVRLVRSRWPLVSIRAYALGECERKPPATAEDALVLRPGYDPEPHPLTAGAGAFVAALMAGATIGDALDAAGDGFDPTATLTLLIAGGAIAALHPGDV